MCGRTSESLLEETNLRTEFQILYLEIPVVDFPCRIYPQWTQIQSLPSTARFEFAYDNIQLEFQDKDVFIYAKFPNGSIYRDDYFVLQITPVQPKTETPADPLYNFIATPFESLQRVSPTEIRLKQTMRNRFNQVLAVQTIFIFGRNDSNIQIGDSSVKFSYQIDSILPRLVCVPVFYLN